MVLLGYIQHQDYLSSSFEFLPSNYAQAKKTDHAKKKVLNARRAIEGKHVHSVMYQYINMSKLKEAEIAFQVQNLDKDWFSNCVQKTR